MMIRWFIFDLGNVLIKLAYERVISRICARASCSRDELVATMEEWGGYRDLERGEVSFEEFHAVLREKVGYSDDLRQFRKVWADFFDGPIEGIDEVLESVRSQYGVAFLSNSNEVHEELIPREFSFLFRKGERFFFSHRHRCAKPDAAIFQIALSELGASADEVVYIDDLAENVAAARTLGMTAFQFESSQKLFADLEAAGLVVRS
jgi:glucose-1-phosphatase